VQGGEDLPAHVGIIAGVDHLSPAEPAEARHRGSDRRAVTTRTLLADLGEGAIAVAAMGAR
jgi:hypothetical protein